jgi:ribosome-associated translation inhibitor RaiA
MSEATGDMGDMGDVTDAGGVVVQARGRVSVAEREYAHEKIGHLRSLSPGPVLFARVELVQHSDPARERPAFAKAELDVNGRLVRGHVASATMLEAIDLLEARVRVQLERLAHRSESQHVRLRNNGDHEWKHGEWTASRPSYFPRPVEERELVRRKTFAIGEMNPDEAVWDLELLDHDFYLFTNSETLEDNVIARTEGGGYELLEPSGTSSLADTVAPVQHSATRPPTFGIEDATQLLDGGGLPFLFFVDPETGRGQILYRRYDGHYGLIVPPDAVT